jgi:putative colanic acid biosynthesis UDP-glucose lipid carrier transferase
MRNSEIINRTIKVGIIGNSNYSKALAKFFVDNKWTGFDLVYFEHEIDTNKITQINQLFINNVDYFIDENSYILLKDLSEVNLTKIKIFSPYFYNKFSNLSNKIGEFFFIELFEIPLNSNFNSLIKRLFDIFLTLTFLILVFWWLYILIAILIKINSNGPVFYKQKRNGIDGNVFECYKFRSMYQNNSNEFRQATKNDYRITRIGKILRKTNLDEIPQIINVLKGEMSIVGPRPHAVEHNSQFSDIIQKYNSRHKVKPGITGLAQVMGYRGETDTLEKMEGRVKYDRFYLYNWNFWLDIRIILLTIRNMILGDKNAY